MTQPVIPDGSKSTVMRQVHGELPNRPAARRPKILHISGDFPDPFASGKTRAIERLLELTDGEFDHTVVSINRQSPALLDLPGVLARRGPSTDGELAILEFHRGLAVRYQAPGKGLFHRRILTRLGDRLAQLLADDPPELVVGHKLTIEGLIAERAAERLGIPFALSLQGDTDLKILSARPDLSRFFRRAFHRAAVVFPFAPWAMAAAEARLGPRTKPSIPLPCALADDTMIAPRIGDGRIVSVFHLDSYRRKNLAGLARAQRLRAARGSATPCVVIGGGSAGATAACLRLASRVPDMTLAGPRTGEALRETVAGGAGMVLPSRRETFGMVFVEALFAGTPIVYPEGQGVAGWFNGAPFALGVNPNDPRSIADAMDRLVENEASVKAALAVWQTSGAARAFTRPAVAAAFRQGLTMALATTG